MKSNSPYPPSVDPGFPELPPTPERWRRTTFGEVLEVVTRPLKLDPNARYRLVNAKRNRGGIALRAEVLGREVLTKTQFEAKAGDFLISRRQIVHGACGVVSDELDGAVVSNEYSTLRTQSTLLMEFLRHYSHTPYFQRSCFHSSHGVTVEKMIFKLDEWLARDVDVPSLSEQRKIATILTAVDEVIEKTETVIESLQTLKKATTQELLTRGLPGRHSRFKQTEIGEVPQDWEVIPVRGVLTECKYGTSEKCHANASGVPVLRIPNVVEGRVLFDDLKYAQLATSDVARYALKAGDVLLIRTNGNPDYVGRTAVFPDIEDTWLYASYLIRLRVDRAMMLPEFLHLALRRAETRRTMRDAIRTSAGNYNLNTDGVGATLVVRPSLDEQRALVRSVSGVDSGIDSAAVELESLRGLKTVLMTSLLTGELRVTLDEDSA